MPGNLTRITQPSSESGETEFWLSDIEQLGEDDDEWGFSLFANKDLFLATFVYPGRESAEAARKAIIPVLTDAVCVITEEMSPANESEDGAARGA